MKKKTIAILVIVALLSMLTYCQKPMRVWAYQWTHAIIGGLSGSTGVPLKVDSSGAVFINLDGLSLTLTGVKEGGVSQIVSQVSKLVSTNLAFSLLELSGAEKTFSIAAGSENGQQITLVKSEYDTRTLKLQLTIDAPPTAHTGWSSVTWPSKAGSFVTVAWPDNTTGWIITGSSPSMIIEY